MKKDIRYIISWLLFFIVLGIFSLGKSAEAKSNTYKRIYCYNEPVVVNGTTFMVEGYGNSSRLYVTRNGQKKTYYSNVSFGAFIITNGIKYYVSMGDSTFQTISLGEVNKEFKELLRVNGEIYLNLEGLYKNKLYYVKGIDPGCFCSYDLKTKKTKTLDKYTTEVNWSGRYFYLTPYAGAPGPKTFKVYDAKKGKKKLISNRMLGYSVRSGKVYYVESINKTWGPINNVKVYRVNANGTKKKLLLKNIKMQYVVEITNKYVKYVNKKGKIVKKKY